MLFPICYIDALGHVCVVNRRCAESRVSRLGTSRDGEVIHVTLKLSGLVFSSEERGKKLSFPFLFHAAHSTEDTVAKRKLIAIHPLDTPRTRRSLECSRCLGEYSVGAKKKSIKRDGFKLKTENS